MSFLAWLHLQTFLINTFVFKKSLQLWDCLIFMERLCSSPTHCTFRDKATNGTRPRFCQLTIHLGLLRLRSVFSSADRQVGSSLWLNYSIQEDGLLLSHVLFNRMGSNSIPPHPTSGGINHSLLQNYCSSLHIPLLQC